MTTPEPMQKYTTASNPELEYMVLGGLLDMDYKSRTIAFSVLDNTLFSDPDNQKAFVVMKQCFEDNPTFDIVWYDSQLAKNNVSPVANQRIMEYYGQVSSVNIEDYADKLKELKLRRHLISEARKLLEYASTADNETDSVVQQLEGIKAETIDKLRPAGLTPKQIHERDLLQPKYGALSMGSDMWDNDYFKEVGRHKGTTEVAVAHTKHGKTEYALWKCLKFMQQGHKGIYFIMEGTDTSIKNKLVRKFNIEEKLLDNLIIIDKPQANTIDKIASLIKYWKIKNDIDFVVVDYMQRIDPPKQSNSSRTEHITQVSNRLTDISIDSKVFMLILAQPHRVDKFRKKWDLQPEARDLDGASAIEKDAHLLTSIFRPVMIKELQVVSEMTGRILNVLDPVGNSVHKNSMFIQQKLNRAEEINTEYIQFIHQEEGIEIAQ